MAILILGKSRCALCNQVLASAEGTVTTSPFIADRAHPLFRYSDAAMHKLCFLEWPSRHDFVRLFNEAHQTRTGERRYMNGAGEIHTGEEVDALAGLCLSFWITLDTLWVRSGLRPLREMLDVPSFKEIWDQLTHPHHIPVFERELLLNLNSMAREWREEALKEAKRRARGS
jgi:hypothetical protein